MTLRRSLAALSAAGLVLGLSACGGGDSEAPSRPAHRPISVIYVVGESRGPWAARTEGLADGVKIAIAERDGLVGERAASVVVVPVVQRDGEQVSAAVGTGRILRDSRALAAIGTWTSPQLMQAAAQLNGGEVTLLQYGSGTVGLLTESGLPGEPTVYQPSGKSLALRGVPSDAAVAAAIRSLPGLRGADVVVSDSAFTARNATLRKEAQQAATKAIAKAREKDPDVSEEDLPDPSGSTIRSLYNEQASDAARLAEQVRQTVGGVTRPVSEAGSRTVAIIDSEQPDAVAEARSLARRTSGTLVLVDAADRAIPASAIGGHRGTVYRVSRTLDDPNTAEARRIRSKERELFGRDRGESVVAGFRAASRILELGANQPARTIERMPYATALVSDQPNDPHLPAEDGQVLLGKVVVERLSGGRWIRQ